MAAAKLRLLASKKFCNTKAIEKDGSILLRYPEDKIGIKEDIFNLDLNHQVVSWVRSDSKGKWTPVNFLPDGSTF